MSNSAPQQGQQIQPAIVENGEFGRAGARQYARQAYQLGQTQPRNAREWRQAARALAGVGNAQIPRQPQPFAGAAQRDGPLDAFYGQLVGQGQSG